MNQNLKFDYVNSKTSLFYNEYGFIHYQPSSSEFKSLIDKCYNYYLNNYNHRNFNLVEFIDSIEKSRDQVSNIEKSKDFDWSLAPKIIFKS